MSGGNTEGVVLSRDVIIVGGLGICAALYAVFDYYVLPGGLLDAPQLSIEHPSSTVTVVDSDGSEDHPVKRYHGPKGPCPNGIEPFFSHWIQVRLEYSPNSGRHVRHFWCGNECGYDAWVAG